MSVDSSRAIVPTDDSFHHHARPDEPFWNESGLFGFMVPERKLDAYFYVWHRPNMQLTSAGVALWDPHGTETHDCLHAEWFHFNPWAEGRDMFDFELGNGMRCRTIEPLRRYELSYTGDGCSFDLEWTGAYHPPNLHYSAEHGFDIYGGVHYEQLGSVVGEIRLHGERVPVDCHHFRDHSRGLRPGPARGVPGGGFDFGWASEKTSFAVTSARPDPRAPVAARSVDVVSYGHFVKDGELGEVVAGTREVVERERDGRPKRVVVELEDARGRQLRAESEVHNCLKWHSLWHMQWCLASWTIDGEAGWGENQDWFDIEVIRAHQRAALLQGAV